MTVTPSGGSATTTTYHYDNANEISDVNGTNYTYDANGNLTNDGNQTYVYDNGDRLTAVKDKNGTTLASFTYDSQGMRKTMTTSAGTTTFHYDENNNVAYETDGSNNIVASYTWNGNQPISMTRGGQTYYYQLNGHGDVVALTDSTGAVVNTYDYDAFGNVVHQTGTVVNPYLYAGYRFDKETGLYYLQARYYDAKTGRFLTLDPIDGNNKNPLTQNGYSYAENSPVIYIDPSGADAIWIENTHDLDGAGHTSLLIQYKGVWYFYYFGNKKTVLTKVPSSAMKSLSAFNKWLKANGSYGYPYNESTYLKGDFSASYSYCYQLLKASPRGQLYHWYYRNCTTTSMDALLRVRGNSLLKSVCLAGASIIPNVNNSVIRFFFGSKF